MNEAFQISVIVLASLQFLLFIALLVMVLKLIKAIDNVSMRVDNLQGEVKKVSEKVDPVINNVNNVVLTVGSITDKINENMTVIRNSVDKLKDAVDDVTDFERKVRRSVEPPVMEAITRFSALIKGVAAFMDKIKRSKNSFPVKLSMNDNHREEYSPENEFDEIEEVTDIAKNEINKRYEDINKELDEVRSRLSELSRNK